MSNCIKHVERMFLLMLSSRALTKSWISVTGDQNVYNMSNTKLLDEQTCILANIGVSIKDRKIGGGFTDVSHVHSYCL